MQNDTGSKKIFETFLRDDFVRSSVVVNYRVDGVISEIILNHSAFGIMTLTPGDRDVHRWESEDEAQDVSYLNRHFTTVLLDGVVNDTRFEEQLIDAIEKDVRDNAGEPDKGFFLRLLADIKKGNYPGTMTGSWSDYVI